MGAPSRDDEAAVRALLWEWDVIGLRDEESPRDEYDCMITPLWSLRSRGAGARGIANWVGREADDHFGLASTAVADERLAGALLRLS